CDSSDSVRKPCAIVPPKGELFARAGSTWIHWKSSIALAKVSMRCCVISTHGETPTSCPTRASRLRMVVTSAGRSFSRRCRAKLRRESLLELVDERGRLAAPARRAGRVEAIELDAYRLVRFDMLADALARAVEVLRLGPGQLRKDLREARLQRFDRAPRGRGLRHRDGGWLRRRRRPVLHQLGADRGIARWQRRELHRAGFRIDPAIEIGVRRRGKAKEQEPSLHFRHSLTPRAMASAMARRMAGAVTRCSSLGLTTTPGSIRSDGMRGARPTARLSK